MADDALGPLEIIRASGHLEVPLYVLRFTKDGECASPRTRAHLLKRLAEDGFTDLYFFSHGWNNEWEVALNRYRHFAHGYAGMRAELGLVVDRPYRPILVGVIWPSTSLLFSWEKGPDIAAAGDAVLDFEDRDAVELLAEDLGDADATRLRELARRPGLDAGGRAELGALLERVVGEEGETGADLLAAWAAEEDGADEGDFGTVDGEGAGPQVAGDLSFLDPRQILRLATVRKMKDRAGKVGANGVASFLRDALGGYGGKVHLIGHSYGARVMLSAVSVEPKPSRQVTSMLLLQPAVNHLCFAADAGEGRPGGYRPALDRVALPILVTHSAKDVPLRKVFHVALRRKKDLGEIEIAGSVPKFGALGGWGPGGDVEARRVKIAKHPSTYALQGTEVIALDGSDGSIGGHGDISNPFTWWALYQLVAEA